MLAARFISSNIFHMNEYYINVKSSFYAIVCSSMTVFIKKTHSFVFIAIFNASLPNFHEGISEFLIYEFE